MNDSSTSTASVHPVIAGHEITTDERGRFNLNAIHRAGGGEGRKRPSMWIQNQQTKELIQELEAQSRNSCFGNADGQGQDKNPGLAPLNTIRGGAYAGTYAHELLAISYAGWISPKFQLQVNQVFLDYRMGRLQQLEQKREALPSPLTPSHQRTLQRAIARRAQALPEHVRRTAYSRIYSYLKDRFEVASYKDIDEGRFTEALGAVESVALDGEYLPKPGPTEGEGGLLLSADEACNLLALCTHAKWMAQRWQDELGPALNALGSRHASECHEHVLAAGRIAHSMQRKAGVLPPAA
ncbi:KilA-N domain-containing protein [Halomonas sp. ATCH28]|uniref:KilA-N domain-containing protein n=1 Tax=Halomonas gemina TaxID=2945105 RepID=A0ABT0T2T1_9GAMM|nr:KilA-N domain-containing protein [Halomonas gemina]MCL7941235.1 KilA-N domain-containing protein [Halomonas gemina]